IIGTAVKTNIDIKVSAIFSSMVMHYIFKEIDDVIIEFRRVLEDDGFIIIRNVTKEEIIDHTLLNFFPEAKKIDMKRMPTSKDIIKKFLETGFKVVRDDVIHNIFANNYKEYYEKIKLRGVSTLRIISDSDFEKGLSKLYEYAMQQNPDMPVYEKTHLFSFQKIS
ncbi:MAG: hypothetical protein JW874_01545, partial [Spirochaetales bacterium]|nr:hypothetical protein [Spirochaetales bacterium]